MTLVVSLVAAQAYYNRMAYFRGGYDMCYYGIVNQTTPAHALDVCGKMYQKSVDDGWFDRTDWPPLPGVP